jgi:uncharacterized oxidoreductase
MVARAGKISVHFVNSSGFGALVAPYGGIDRRLSANPIAAGIPVEGGEPIVVDMSTCTIAEGKIKVASNQGVTVPDDCLLDAEGAPTDDPARFYADPPGSILPIAGHKGYALSFLVEILAGAFTGSGCTDPARAKAMVNGMLTIVLDPERIERDWGFADEVRRYIEFVKSSRLRNADGEILLPGEPEQRTRKRRLAEGIELDETTLQQLIETARSVGVSDEAIAVDALRHD